MTEPLQIHRAVRGVLFPPSGKTARRQNFALALLAGAVACAAGPMPALALGAIFLAAAGLVLGPPRAVITIFVLFMVLSHPFRSPFVIPVAGIVWHPRELLLAAVLLHGLAQTLRAKARPTTDPVHLCISIYALFYVFIFGVGLLRGYPLADIIAESRYPVFLSVYLVFASLLSTPSSINFIARAVFTCALLIAAAGITFFAYTLVTGNIVNVQNALGEFVQRKIGANLVQSVRPNGHMYSEIAFTVLVSLLAGGGLTRRAKILALMCLGIFGAAIAITMMRTAYAALLFSLGCLALIMLPLRRLQLTLALGGLCAFLVFFAFLGTTAFVTLTEFAPGLDTSLQGRFVEIKGAWEGFLNYPVLGAGMGASVEGFGYSAVKTSQLTYTQATFHTMHNIYSYFLFKGGILGASLVLLGLGGLLLRGYVLTGQLESRWNKAFIRGLTASLAGQLIASLAMPRLFYPEGHVLLALIASAFSAYASSIPDKLKDSGLGADKS